MQGEEIFERRQSKLLYGIVHEELTSWDDVMVRVSKTQVAFRRRVGFGFCWDPSWRVRTEVPMVVTFGLHWHEEHSRIKAVAHPSPNRWTHHVEVRHASELDDELFGFLRQAWELAE